MLFRSLELEARNADPVVFLYFIKDRVCVAECEETFQISDIVGKFHIQILDVYKRQVVEDGQTFEENALIKATTIADIARKMPEYKNCLLYTSLTGGGEQFLMMQGMNGTHDIRWLTIMMLIHFVFTLFSLSSRCV